MIGFADHGAPTPRPAAPWGGSAVGLPLMAKPSTGCVWAALRGSSTACGPFCGWRPRRRGAHGAVFDSRTLRSTPEGGKRIQGSKPPMAVDTPSHLLALHVTLTNGDDRAAVGDSAEALQEATGQNTGLAHVEQGMRAGGQRRAGSRPRVGRDQGALKPSGVSCCGRGKKRSFARTVRCHRLARDRGRLPWTLASLHLVASVILLLRRASDFTLFHNSLSTTLAEGLIRQEVTIYVCDLLP